MVLPNNEVSVSHHRTALLPVVGAALWLGSCGSDTVGPADLVGQYAATTFTITDGSGTSDVLAEGGSLLILLAADGSASGQLSVPASLNDGTPFTAAMDGTFTVANGIVTFTQAADTFVRDLSFTVSGRTLTASGTFSGVTIHLVLTRQ
jgi:hypothetical protein